MPGARRTQLLIRKPADIRPSEITSKTNYLNRREFIRAGAIAGGSLLAPAGLAAVIPEGRRAKLDGVSPTPFGKGETLVLLDETQVKPARTFERRGTVVQIVPFIFTALAC